MVKKQSQDFFPFFLGIYNVEMHQNLYPFQSSMDAQRILCKRFQLVGFQSTGQNRQISALSRFSIAKKRNWTLGRFFFLRTSPNKIQQSYQRLLRPSGTCENFAGRCCGKGWCPRWTEVGRLMGGGFFFCLFSRLFDSSNWTLSGYPDSYPSSPNIRVNPHPVMV